MPLGHIGLGKSTPQEPIMGNSRKQSHKVKSDDRKTLRRAVRHKAKVTVMRRIEKPAQPFQRLQG